MANQPQYCPECGRKRVFKHSFGYYMCSKCDARFNYKEISPENVSVPTGTDADFEDNVGILTKQQEINLFINIIADYGVKASYGANQTMAIDKPFIDVYDCFKQGIMTYEQKDIAPIWKQTVFGQFRFDESNMYVNKEIEEGKADYIPGING